MPCVHVMYCNTVIPLSFLLLIPSFLSVCLSAFVSAFLSVSVSSGVCLTVCLLASASLSLCLSVRPSFLSPFPVCTCFFVCLYLFQHSPFSLSCLSLTPGNELAFYVRCINDGRKEPNESPAACFLVPIMLCRLTEKFITASDGEVIGGLV